jgi:hypothetical protein
VETLGASHGGGKTAAVDFNHLELAYGFVSSPGYGEHHAYVSLDTGRIYWLSEEGAVEEEEVPEDLETSERYILVPHQHDLDLGRPLALDFAADELPNQLNEIEDCFRRRGAYDRFKAVLERSGCLGKWYRFEADATEKALREWCAENGLEVAGAQPA